MGVNNSAHKQPTSNELIRRNFNDKWYRKSNPFYYCYPTISREPQNDAKRRELHRSFTDIYVNDSTIIFIGEGHEGPTRFVDFHHNEEQLTIITDASNKLYREAKSVKGLRLREPYFAHWYKCNNLTDSMKNNCYKKIVQLSIPYTYNFKFIPTDYSESVMDCPLFAPYISLICILSSFKLKDTKITEKYMEQYRNFIPKSLNLTITDLRESKYYNDSLPEEYYTEILQRYNYNDLTQFKENLEKIQLLSAIEFFNDVTFRGFEKRLNRYKGRYVKAYFECYKPVSLLDYYTSVIDIVHCIEIFDAIDRKDKTILVCTGNIHIVALITWITTVFSDELFKYKEIENEHDNIASIIDTIDAL